MRVLLIDMKKITTFITLLLSMATFAVAAGEGWETSIDQALELAKKEKKPLLVEFTGSDWCPPCIMMRKKVFTKKEFISKASEKYILVEIDIPNKDPELKKNNIKILEKYGVQGVPTVILLDPAGKEFERFSAVEHPSVKSFLGRLDKEHKKLKFN